MCVTKTACPSLKNSFVKEYTWHNLFDYKAMKHYFPRVAIVPTSPLLPVFLAARDPARSLPHFIVCLSPFPLLSVCNFRNKLPSKRCRISSVSSSCNWVINDGCRLDTHMLLETRENRNSMLDLRLASGCAGFFFFPSLYRCSFYLRGACGHAVLTG